MTRAQYLEQHVSEMSGELICAQCWRDEQGVPHYCDFHGSFRESVRKALEAVIELGKKAGRKK